MEQSFYPLEMKYLSTIKTAKAKQNIEVLCVKLEWCQLINWSNKYVLSTYYVPVTVLDVRGTSVNQINNLCALVELTFLEEAGSHKISFKLIRTSLKVSD
jgi:hypothetical protein